MADRVAAARRDGRGRQVVPAHRQGGVAPQGGMKMTRLRAVVAGGAMLLALAACHRDVEMAPLIDRKIYLTDKFYDVKALSPEKAIVVGYGGKILTTNDSGRSWNVAQSNTDKAIYKVAMADETNGWAVGQGGTVLKTTDGGQTWQPMDAGTQSYLFSAFSLSPQH